MPEIGPTPTPPPPPQGRRDGSTPDEAHAFAAREFLRRLAAGKVATFRVETAAGVGGGRTYGSVILDPGAVNASLEVARAGYARVRAPREGADPAPGQAELLAAAAAAEAAGRGVFSRDPPPPPPRAASRDGGPALLASAGGAGAAVDAIVEHVSSGSSLRVTIPAGPAAARGVPVLLAGVVAPAAAAPRAADGDGAAGAVDPYGPVAKHFVEARALSRDVALTLRGVDKHGNLLASVAAPAPTGDVARALAAAGLAKAAEWGLAVLPPPDAAALREADRAARAGRVGVWKGYTPPAGGAAKASGTFTGVVAEAVSGDVVVVAPDGGAPPRRLCLASIRAPRGGRRGEPGEPWAAEAKETLRKALVGKAVTVTAAYDRKVPAGGAAAAPGAEIVLHFASLALAKPGAASPDPAVRLLGAGLATVAKHRADDERAAAYEAYVEAETAAKAAKKGLHSGKEPPADRINDVSAPG